MSPNPGMQLKFSEKNDSYLLNVKVNQNLRKARVKMASEDLHENFIVKSSVIKGK